MQNPTVAELIIDGSYVEFYSRDVHGINVLKTLIIMILYTHMGMTSDESREIVIWDVELHFQTMCLRDDGEKSENI